MKISVRLAFCLSVCLVFSNIAFGNGKIDDTAGESSKARRETPTRPAKETVSGSKRARQPRGSRAHQGKRPKGTSGSRVKHSIPSAFKKLFNALHDIDESARDYLRLVGTIHDDFVSGSKHTFGNPRERFEMSEGSGNQWHCLPQPNLVDIFGMSSRLFKTAVFNVSTDGWSNDQGFVIMDVTRDSNMFCKFWTSFHPSIPKFDFSTMSVKWILLTERPINIQNSFREIILSFGMLSEGWTDYITGLFGTCPECSRTSEIGRKGGCGHLPKQCYGWSKDKFKECRGTLPVPLGNVECVNEGLRGKGWCALTVGPWNNVCVRIRDAKPDAAYEPPAYTMELYTQYDLKYLKNLVAGSTIIQNAAVVAETRWTHYILGYALGAVAAVVFLVYNFVKGTQQAIPISFIRNLAWTATPILAISMLGPMWNNIIYPQCLNIVHYYFCVRKSCLAPNGSEFWWSTSIKCLVTCCGFLGSWIVWKFKLFKSVVSKEPETDEFGREDEVVHRPWEQILLSRFWHFCGYGMLCRCTSNGLVSAVVVFCLYFRRILFYRFLQLYQWYYSVDPAYYRNLVSEEEYDEMGKETTKSELENLRSFFQTPEGKRKMAKLQHYEETTRFSYGGQHVETMDDDESGSGWWCTIS